LKFQPSTLEERSTFFVYGSVKTKNLKFRQLHKFFNISDFFDKKGMSIVNSVVDMVFSHQ